MKENTLQNKCIELLKKNRIYYVNIYGSSRTGKGTPDILACINGKFYAFELKVGKNKASDIQLYRLKEIERNGGKGYIIRSADEIKDILEKEGVLTQC